MSEIRERLFALRDAGYAAFQSRLVPDVAPEKFIGVRVPDVRKLARELTARGGYEPFLRDLPHGTYDENMLHGLLLSEIKDYDLCVEEVDRFLPYVDNWAVCDIMSPKCFRKNRERLLPQIRRWTASPHVYTCRFGMEMLMTHYLDGDFDASYLEIPAAVRSEEYYVNMMIAWFFATALTKQRDATLPYIEGGKLGVWVHNKTIQKACESYRISDADKAYLRTLKRGKQA